ncbi:MAG TPA: type II toxin-antitoxin system VapC family toxin [Capsulimonadaceae bacterium]|jgi:PIN domain nuclease of toxin-antitoxin system
MRVLLDTHTLLWYAAGDPHLSATALAAVNAPNASSVVSAATLWEIAIKVGLGKLSLGEPTADFWARHSQNGVELLQISAEEALYVETLPLHHRDPFDRILIAQSIIYQIPIISKDGVYDQYGVSRIW